MKLQRKLAIVGIAVATLLTGSTVTASTMNIPYTSGRVHNECDESSQGGIMLGKDLPLSDESCWVDVPLPIDPGHLIQQVSVFYGTQGQTSDFRASIGFKELQAAKINDSFNGVELFDFASSANVPPRGMALANLMGQSSTGVIYPDQFEVSPNRTYFVRVMMRNGSEFFGLRVTYD